MEDLQFGVGTACGRGWGVGVCPVCTGVSGCERACVCLRTGCISLCVPLRTGLRVWRVGILFRRVLFVSGSFCLIWMCVIFLDLHVCGFTGICESLCVGLPPGPPHQALNATLLPECAEECWG